MLEHYIKTREAIAKMRIAGKLAASVLDMITQHVRPGISTDKLNTLCHTFITEDLQAIPAPLHYKGFPKSICTSVNHVVCHGIPDSNKVLRQGDIINIDVTVIKDGYHGDTSRMFYVGEPSILAKRLVETARACMYAGINLVKPGQSLKTIGKKIEALAKEQHFSSVYDYCGHGIGSDFHESGFQILHYDHPSIPDIKLLPGLTFTIEPMINAGKRFTKVLGDDWTVVTKDRSLSAQWEHTLLCTEDGVEILTLGAEEQPIL